MRHPDPATLNVPAAAIEVGAGFPFIVRAPDLIGAERISADIFAPHMASPRPRITRRGAFMPDAYTRHVGRLCETLAAIRGTWEVQTGRPWDATRIVAVTIALWAPSLRGDLDNIAKTILDAGQLHRGEEPGAELWANDSQVHDLRVVYDPTDDPAWEYIELEVRATGRPSTSRKKPNAATEPGQGATIGRDGTATTRKTRKRAGGAL